MFARIRTVVLYVVALGGIAAAAWGLYVWSGTNKSIDQPAESAAQPLSGTEQPVKLTTQAQKNLRLVAKPAKLTSYWRTIDVPGVIVDRPGVSDRGVVAPVTGIITKIYHHPGDAVEPNAPLFGIRLMSESLHTSQLELFKATREIEIAREQRKRLEGLSQTGALAQSRLIEIDNQIRRLEVNEQAYRQDLQARGLPDDRIAAAAKGEFVTEIIVKSPSEKAMQPSEIALTSVVAAEPETPAFKFELHDLQVALGQQVEAGQMLCRLADHRRLLIEGRGFKEDMPLVQEAAKNGWEIEVEYELEVNKNWPPPPQTLQIQHVANVIDEQQRTFGFYLPLENQWRSFERNGETRLLWRFRPGDRVRLHVAVERFDDVFVLPHDAVVRDGAEAYVFRQNGEFFNRKPVHILYEDRRHIVIANDGSVRPGSYLAQNAAASINRVGKAQAASGEPVGVHVHPDGTVHAAH